MTQLLVVLALLFQIYRHNAQAQNATLICDRPPPTNQSESPKYLCEVDITVIGNRNCTAFVTERYLLPYTTGRDAKREIPLIERQQTATNVVAKLDNKIVFTADELRSKDGRSEALVRFPTKKGNRSTLFTLQYTLDSRVTRFTTSWPETDAEPPEGAIVNVLRWRTSTWDQKFDKMRVKFINAGGNAYLSVAAVPKAVSSSFSGRNSTVTLVGNNVAEPIDVLVAERGTVLCSSDLEHYTGVYISLPALAIIIMASVTCFLCCFFGRCMINAENRERVASTGGGGGGGGGGGVRDVGGG